MAIKRPDIYEHNNPNYAFVDSNFVRGGLRSFVSDLNELYSLIAKRDQLKEYSTIVYVVSESKYYVLIDINNIDNSSGWEVFNSGSNGIVNAINGLTKSGDTISLGGDLINNTVINDIRLNKVGIEYGGNYSSSFTNRSLVDKEYVDTKINIVNVNNINNNGIPPYYILNNDRFIGVSGYSINNCACIYLPNSPNVGQQIIIADIQGNAVLYPIFIDGNGININESSVACINTNYGSLTLIFNSYFWSAVSFIN